MLFATEVCEPTKWEVVMRDGSVVTVWADSAEGLAGPDDERDYRFCNLLDVVPERQAA